MIILCEMGCGLLETGLELRDKDPSGEKDFSLNFVLKTLVIFQGNMQVTGCV